MKYGYYKNKKFEIYIKDLVSESCPQYKYSVSYMEKDRGSGCPVETFNEAYNEYVRLLISYKNLIVYKDKRFTIRVCDINKSIVLGDSKGDSLWSNCLETLKEEMDKRKRNIKVTRQLTLWEV